MNGTQARRDPFMLKPIHDGTECPSTQKRRSIERRFLSVLLIALRRVARWHAKGVEQRPFALRINKLGITSREWAGRQCAKGVGRVAPPASRVSEPLKKRRKRRLLRVRCAERKGGARPASRSLSRWMLTTGKFIQAKLTRVNTFPKKVSHGKYFRQNAPQLTFHTRLFRPC